MKYWILLICLVIVGAQNSTIPFLPQIKVENGKMIMNIDEEGGTEIDGIVYNSTLVYGRFPDNNKRNKRWFNTVKLCTDSNLGGSCFTMNSGQMNIYDLSTIQQGQFANSISSLQVMDLHYTIHVWTGTNGQGTCWAFRSPVEVSNLANYGINDNIESVTVDYSSLTPHGLTLYEDASYAGKSALVFGDYTPSYLAYNSMSSTGTCGTIGNDKASSLVLLPYTVTTLYSDANLQGTPNSYGYGSSLELYYAVSPNDQASSLTVQYTQ